MLRRVSPFGDPRIDAYVPLPVAYRSLSRPSSAPDAKAFPLRSFQLDLVGASFACAVSRSRWACFSVRLRGCAAKMPLRALALRLFLACRRSIRPGTPTLTLLGSRQLLRIMQAFNGRFHLANCFTHFSFHNRFWILCCLLHIFWNVSSLFSFQGATSNH